MCQFVIYNWSHFGSGAGCFRLAKGDGHEADGPHGPTEAGDCQLLSGGTAEDCLSPPLWDARSSCAGRILWIFWPIRKVSKRLSKLIQSKTPSGTTRLGMMPWSLAAVSFRSAKDLGDLQDLEGVEGFYPTLLFSIPILTRQDLMSKNQIREGKWGKGGVQRTKILNPFLEL